MGAIIMERGLRPVLVISAGTFSGAIDFFPSAFDFDLCRMGKPLPDGIYKERTSSRVGLNLPRGPDPRSFSPALAVSAATGRSLFGLEM
jgi:hypothetical protein